MILRISLLLAGSLAGVQSGKQSVDSLAKRAVDSHATPQGKAYGGVAVATFLGDGSFIRDCAPKGAATPMPVTVFFEVRKDGRLGRLVMVPEGPPAVCIRKHVAGRRFPAPPGDFVQKLDVKFTP